MKRIACQPAKKAISCDSASLSSRREEASEADALPVELHRVERYLRVLHIFNSVHFLANLHVPYE